MLRVPGARLSYEVRGSGPVLLMIPGGPADSTVFAPAVPLLTDAYTVVTYDPRGISRSTVDDPTQDVPVDLQANEEPPGAPAPETDAVPNQMQGTIELFLGHMLRQITRYGPDAAALRAASARVVVAFGTASTGQTAHRVAVALANLLGTTIVAFPGGDGPFMSHPEAFARTLHQVLTDTT